MSYSLLTKENKLGPLKIEGTARAGTIAAGKRGFFFPVFLTIQEAALADKEAGGKGIFNTITLYNRSGEFYIPATSSFLGTKDPQVYTLYEGPGAENPFSRIKNKLSTLIPDQMPSFVNEEYETFVTFLTAYYEFLEQNNKAQETLENLATFTDIDETAEELVQNFFTTYAEDITKSEISDNRYVLKKIRELYSKKGSETAFRLLFSFLFRETIEFFYPYTVILKASDGKWKTDYSLKVKKNIDNSNLFDFENTLVQGAQSRAIGIVNKVIQINLGQYEYYELILDYGSIQGTFIAGENIEAIKSFTLDGTLVEISASLYSVLSSIEIIDAGLGYEIGQEIDIIDSRGKYAKAFISGVDRFGGIRNIRILDSGFDYSGSTIIDPGLPTKKLYGDYTLQKGKVTLTFPVQHGLTKGKEIFVEYGANIFSPVYGTSHSAVVLSVPSPRTLRYKYPGAD